MKRKAILVGAAAALLSAAAWAHWGGGYGGYGMGPGMMGYGYGGYGAYGMGPGMMGYGGYRGGYCFNGDDDLAGLGLTAEQRDKIAAIQREAWEKQAGSIDRAQLETRKRIESVLTDEQKRKLGGGS